MAMLVHEDPSVLSQDDMVLGVNNSLLDASTMVRDEAVAPGGAGSQSAIQLSDLQSYLIGHKGD